MQTYANWYRDNEGRGSSGATVSVYTAGTNILAQIYSPNGAAPVGSPNPFQTSATGFFSFRAPNGTYDIQIQGQGSPTEVISNWVAHDGTGGSIPATPDVQVSITPLAAALTLGGTQTFSASVTGDPNTAVTWAVNGVWEGDAANGLLTGTGNTRTYTAPGSAGSYVVSATSVANPTISASATVTCATPVVVGILLTPSVPTSIPVSTSLALTATITGTANLGSTWTVDGVANGNASTGLITGSGNSRSYTAPSAPGAHIITVTSSADPTKLATITVTGTSVAVVKVTLSPGTANITAGATQIFTPAVTGSANTSVSWDIDGITNGNATVGSIDLTGNARTYTAPAAPGTHTIRATSIADPSKSASSAITVTAAATVAVSLLPAVASVQVLATTTLTATVTGNANTAVTWTVDAVANGNSTVGTITGSGNTRTYTAPASAGSHTIVATSVADGSKNSSCAMTVTSSSLSVAGFGVAVTGGAGQTVVHVTNLNDSGAGSFRAAMGSNRYIVFDVGGSITLNSKVTGNSLVNLTIDGSTAPSPGITFLKYPIQLNTSHNVIVTNFRHRAGNYGGGDATGDGGCVVFYASYDLVIDRISFSGDTDEMLDLYGGSHDATIQNCIFGVAATGFTSLQYMVADHSYNVTCYHNLSYLGGYRSPALQWDTSGGTIATGIVGDVVNNLDWRYLSYGATVYWGAKGNVVGNYFYSTTHPGESGRAVNIESGGLAYSSGNYSKDGSSLSGNVGSAYTVPAPNQISASSAAVAAAYCVANAGCRVGGLDAYDQAIINEINSTGL